MEKDKKPVRLISPFGVAVYPRLNQPDTKFNEDGVYSVRLALDPQDESVEKFLKELERLHAEAVEEARALKPGKRVKVAPLPWQPELDADEEETGRVLVNFKLNALFRDKKTGETVSFRPAIFDSEGKIVNPSVGGGTKLRVSFDVKSFLTPTVGAGISLRLRAVQIKELVEYVPGGTAESFGFSKVEGYCAPEEEDEAPVEDAESSAEGDF